MYKGDTIAQEFMNPFKLEAEDTDEEEDDKLQSSSYISGSQSHLDFSRNSPEPIPCSPELVSQKIKPVTPQKTLTPSASHTLPSQASLDSIESRSSTEGSPYVSPSREISRKGAMSRKDKAKMDKSRQRASAKNWFRSKSSGSSDSDIIIEHIGTSSISKKSKDSPVPVVPEIILRRPSIPESHVEIKQSNAPSVVTISEETSDVHMHDVPAVNHQQVTTESKSNKPSVSPVHKSRQALKRQPELEMISQDFGEFKKVGMSPKQNSHKQSPSSMAKENSSEISNYFPVDSKSGVVDTSPIVKPFSQSSQRVQASSSPERIPFDNEFKKVLVSHSRSEKAPTDMPSAYSPKKSPTRSQTDFKDISSTPREDLASSVKNQFSTDVTNISPGLPVKPLPRANIDDSVENFESRTLEISNNRPILSGKLSPLSSDDSSSMSMKGDQISVSNDRFSQSGPSTESKPNKPVPRSRQNTTNKDVPVVSAVVAVSTGKDSSSLQQVKPIPKSRNARSNDHSPPSRRVLPQMPKRSSLDSPTHSPIGSGPPIRGMSQPLKNGSTEKQKESFIEQSARKSFHQSIEDKAAIPSTTTIPSQYTTESSASFQLVPEKVQAKENNEDEIDFSAIRRKSVKHLKKKPISDSNSSSSFAQPEDFDGSPQLRGRSRPVQSISRPRMDSGLKEDDLDSAFPRQSRLRSSAVSGMQRPKRFQKPTSPLPNGKK